MKGHNVEDLIDALNPLIICLENYLKPILQYHLKKWIIIFGLKSRNS